MDVEARRDMIIGIVTPLLLEHGTAVTSRQIAEATGLAEGTIFRAFGDKESLIEAVLDRYYDPQTVYTALRAIPADLPLDELVLCILQVVTERVRSVVRMVSAMGGRRPPEQEHQEQHIVEALLEPHREHLRVPPARVVDLIRIMAFSAAFPAPTTVDPLTPVDLTDLLMNGVLR